MQLAPYPRPGEDSDFRGWSLGCGPALPGFLTTPTACARVDLDVFSPGGLSKRLEVNFGRPFSEVTVRHAGLGRGVVTSSPGGIACTSDRGEFCSAEFADGSTVTVHPRANADGSRFIGWSGACAGTNPCTILVDRAVTVTANFDRPLGPGAAPRPRPDPPPPRVLLLVSKNGTGEGRVRTVPRSAGIDCGIDCEERVRLGRRVILRATAQEHSQFAGWTGPCADAPGAACRVTMNRARGVRATFTRIQRRLGVRVEGGGVVRSSPPGIECGPAGGPGCTTMIDSGTAVTLGADPDDGWAFAGWSGGGCADNEVCPVTMDADRDLVARFIRIHTLYRGADGHGRRRDRGADPRRRPGDLPARVPVHGAGRLDDDGRGPTRVRARPSPDSRAHCTGTAPCTVVLDADRTVRARFDAPPDTAALNVAVLGPGEGRVVSDPAGIDCRPDCLEPYALNSTVTLRAEARAGLDVRRVPRPVRRAARDRRPARSGSTRRATSSRSSTRRCRQGRSPRAARPSRRLRPIRPCVP